MNEWDRNERRTHFVNRFRGRSFEGNLEVMFDETKEAKRMATRIEQKEKELRELRTEEYIAKRAFATVRDEERVRLAKAAIGIRDENEALVQEVYERAQQVSKLRGENASWRSNVHNAYAQISRWVKHGEYSRRERDFDPLFVEYQLISSARTIMYNDTAKKGADLNDRVIDRANDLWNQWNLAGQPVDRRKEVA